MVSSVAQNDIGLSVVAFYHWGIIVWPCLIFCCLVWSCVAICGLAICSIIIYEYCIMLYITFSRGHKSKVIWSCIGNSGNYSFSTKLVEYKASPLNLCKSQQCVHKKVKFTVEFSAEDIVFLAAISY